MAMQVDARGYSCPQPVTMTKRALDGMVEGELEVLVDSPAARDNVSRFAQYNGCVVSVSDEGDGSYVIRITRKRS